MEHRHAGVPGDSAASVAAFLPQRFQSPWRVAL